MVTKTQNIERSSYSNFFNVQHRLQSLTVARFVLVVFFVHIITIPTFARSECRGQKNDCSCSCKMSRAAQRKKERAKNCAAMQENAQQNEIKLKKSCAKKNKNIRAKSRGCSKSGPTVCAQPPMPPCPPDKMCAQVMPPARWFANRCAAEKEGATVTDGYLCQESITPQ
jgi:hypothetical protein